MEGDETAEPPLVKREGSPGRCPKPPSANLVKIEGNDVGYLVSMVPPGTMVQAPKNVDGDGAKDARVPPPGVTSYNDQDFPIIPDSACRTEINDTKAKELPADTNVAHANDICHAVNKDEDSNHVDDLSDSSSELSEPGEYSDDDYVDPAEARIASRQEKKEGQLAKAKPRTPRRPAKNVAEYAARLSASRKEAFLKYMVSNLGLVDQRGFIPPPPARNKSKKKQKSNDVTHVTAVPSDMPSFSSVEEQEPTFVTKADNMREIAKCTNSVGNNRHGKTQKRDVKEGSKVFGRAQVRCYHADTPAGPERRYQIKGMIAMLKEYQLPLAAWWVLQEHSDIGPQGGIVADMPGFGKTVVTLAAIHGNQPEKAKRDAGEGATLVVAPNAPLAQQWRDEIRKHLGLKYYNQTVLMSALRDYPLDRDDLARRLIVIATYTELRMSYEATPSAHVHESDEDYDDAEPTECVRGFPLGADENPMADDYIKGMLHKVQFFRLVLDEVHNIKRHTGMTFRAAYAIKAQHKWGLSGTPLSNRIEELYSYTKLIGCTNITSFQEFKDVYVLSSDAKDRIDVLMTNNSYRRTDQDLFLGNRMMKLPQKHMEDQNVQLTAVEKAIQEWLDIIFDTDDNARTGNKKYVGHMRYRQLVSHAYSLESFLRDDGPNGVSVDELQVLLEMVRKAEEQPVTPSTLDQIGCWSERQVNHDVRSSSVAKPKTLNPFGNSEFGTRCCSFTPLIEMIIDYHQIRAIGCSGCNGPVSDPQKAQACGHYICGGCLTEWLKTEQRTECPRCNATTQFLKVITLGFVLNNRMPAAGSKLTAVKDTLLRWKRDFPGDKCIIFVQFVKTLLMTGIMLQLEGIDFVYTYGKMLSKQKSKAKTIFETDPTVKVLVATMGTCSEGLNLTCANRVIVVDAWWNSAREQQSFGRVVRTGQCKETYCVRLKSPNSIDDKIEKIQTSKNEVVDCAVQDDGHDPFTLSELGVMNLLNPEKYLELCKETLSKIKNPKATELAK
ncbi:DNA repair protein RAD5 like [Verticillium longisporum]|uniref:DNA repair protein RAD5 like n=1 Tax=Verticillium longisporum TaxID=100787 RepID=A0A8I3AX03_VERLO|nr:DNA repair protein RAD5 like [Verticillium longisporum]